MSSPSDVRLDLDRDVRRRMRARGCSRAEAVAALLPRPAVHASGAGVSLPRCRCGSSAVRHISVQLRRGDECETSALVCMACDHTWVMGR